MLLSAWPSDGHHTPAPTRRFPALLNTPIPAASVQAQPAPTALPDLAHVWDINAQVEVTAQQAKIADFRGSLRVKEQTRIDALDVMCRNCRRAFEDVADRACEAKINNQHLIGGDQRERAKRKKPAAVGSRVVMPGPRINRRGMGGVLSREA